MEFKKYIICVMLILIAYSNIFSQAQIIFNTNFSNVFANSGIREYYYNQVQSIGLTMIGLGNIGTNVDIRILNARSNAVVHTYANRVILANAGGGALQVIDNTPVAARIPSRGIKYHIHKN